MTLEERVEWAASLTPRQLIEYANSDEALALDEQHAFAMWYATVCDLEEALDRDDFEQSGLDMVEPPILVAEAACEEPGPFNFSDRVLSAARARRLHKSAMVDELEKGFVVP